MIDSILLVRALEEAEGNQMVSGNRTAAAVVVDHPLVHQVLMARNPLAISGWTFLDEIENRLKRFLPTRESTYRGLMMNWNSTTC